MILQNPMVIYFPDPLPNYNHGPQRLHMNWSNKLKRLVDDIWGGLV